jgi:hypothetical protein
MPDPRITTVFDAVNRIGQTVTVRRLSGTQQIPLDVVVRAVVRGYGPDELLGGVQQGDRRVILTQHEMEQGQWCWPVKVQDRVIIDGRTTTVQSVETRKIGNDIAMYVLQVRG